MKAGSELLPILVFGLLALAGFGVGDVIVKWVLRGANTDVQVRPLLAVALGLSAIGNGLFVAGIFGTLYRRGIIWPLLLIGAATGCLAVVRTRQSLRLPSFRGLSVWEIATMTLVGVYAVRWFLILKGFTTGADSLSHHYPHAKFMIKAGRYGHAVQLPWGLDNASNYNASLTQMLYVVGHLLADERASNLLHWLTQIMLIASIYLLGRTLRSRAAGLMAVAIYLGAGLLGHETLSVQDYTMTAVLTLLTIYAIVMMRRSERTEWLLLAAILAGCVASSKNYGVAILIPVGILLVCWFRGQLIARIRAGALFAGIAFLIYCPWFFYNLITMGDPWFPFFRRVEMSSILRATEGIDILLPFIIPGRSGTLIPRLIYFSSMFIPFEPRFMVFGVGIISLIGIPVSAYYTISRRSERWLEPNALFIVSIAVFFVIYEAIGRVAFYKWAVFPAAIYFASLAALVTEWPPVSRNIAWAFVVLAALLNYRYIGSPRMKDYLPTGTQRERWDSLTVFLNDHLERGVTVAGVSFTTDYYLRPDLSGLQAEDGLATNWKREEAIIRATHASYFVTYPNRKQQIAEWYRSMIDGWRTVESERSPNAQFLESVLDRNQRRFVDRDEFLARSGSLWQELPDGTCIYRLAIDRQHVSSGS